MLTHFYFGGARSLAFAQLRNVPKVQSDVPFFASECPDVALELARDIFEFFDL